MSSSSKKRLSNQRKIGKQKRKATKQAQFESWRDEGKNKKSKRFTLNQRRLRSVANKHRHLIPNCGNPGCKRCFPKH